MKKHNEGQGGVLMNRYEKLDVFVPVPIEIDWLSEEEVIAAILEQYTKYGYHRFALAAPCGGWRGYGYPSKEDYKNYAAKFSRIRDTLLPYGISCGWWNTLTLKSGPEPEFGRMVRPDGKESPVANCPLDPGFSKRFCSDIALFAKEAKPEFIIFEDDYSINSGTMNKGCFCKYHLAEFAKVTGKEYTREALLEIFSQQTPESYDLQKKWRWMMGDTLAEFSKKVRAAVDVDSPEIPIGTCQSGCWDFEGDATERVSRALAGEKHTPFSRLHGAAYCDTQDAKRIPEIFSNTLYHIQHTGENFAFYSEADCFPHTRFFASGKKMKTHIAVGLSYGMDGILCHLHQLLDDLTEEEIYAKTYAPEMPRFEEVRKNVKLCRLHGVEVCYDPYANTLGREFLHPLWLRTLSLFGIPYIMQESAVAFWDAKQAEFFSDDAILKQLSKGLFLDGAAAKILWERGFGEYIGVKLGDDVADGALGFDLAAREVIQPPFDTLSKGKHMTSAYMFAVGRNGKLLRMEITDEKCEVISEMHNFKRECVCPAMVRFENKLGGKIVTMGMTLENNLSQSLFNYRRRTLIQHLIKWCSDSYVFVENEPNIYTIANAAKDPKESGFTLMLTLINLGDDDAESTRLHLPKQWEHLSEFFFIDQKGQWVPLDCTKQGNTLTIHTPLTYCEPLYLIAK